MLWRSLPLIVTSQCLASQSSQGREHAPVVLSRKLSLLRQMSEELRMSRQLCSLSWQITGSKHKRLSQQGVKSLFVILISRS
mmetsp:Transcript_57857/g.188051  ORF Transcript_57857/g.188051 Transcript_57857/m.188051 type:complete len:82 (-) Transcript_57857:553-798(-)